MFAGQLTFLTKEYHVLPVGEGGGVSVVIVVLIASNIYL